MSPLAVPAFAASARLHVRELDDRFGTAVRFRPETGSFAPRIRQKLTDRDCSHWENIFIRISFI
jgi:hypothetical protein